jgi:putative ABC transport system ATP-binding protein
MTNANPTPDNHAIIETRSVTKQFEIPDSAPVSVLQGISLQIRPGESVALLGPSGSGKSTLLSILAGLESATQGGVLFAGADLGRMSSEELSHLRGTQMGFVFQSYHLIPTLTAFENIALPLELFSSLAPSEIRSRVESSLSALGLNPRRDHFPRQLSGGEQQRIAVARALIHQPRVVFADEPTGNLDTKNSQIVLDQLFNLKNSTTLILVTHDESSALRADRIIRLRDGKIEADDLKVSQPKTPSDS